MLGLGLVGAGPGLPLVSLGLGLGEVLLGDGLGDVEVGVGLAVGCGCTRSVTWNCGGSIVPGAGIWFHTVPGGMFSPTGPGSELTL